ncbi:MAG: GNAT family N-acetyltransferase [Dehalococcoidales bacterium]|nr:GNAT family N-acetyltransferase [Dehalococcoidales bacterium]
MTTELQVQVRPMQFSDLKALTAIDQEIRASGTQVFYKDFATRTVLRLNPEGASTKERPDIQAVASLIDLSFVAECGGTIGGFILGRQEYLAESDIQQGGIALLAVSPHYFGKGIATRLVDAICELFRSRGINRVGMAVDPADKSMLAFVERYGFKSNRLLNYHKNL